MILKIMMFQRIAIKLNDNNSLVLRKPNNINEFEMMTSLLCKTITCSNQGGNYSTNVKNFISFVSRKILLFKCRCRKIMQSIQQPE